MEYEGESFDAKKGDVVLLDCAKPHYYQAMDGLEFVYIHFDGSNSHEICGHILKLFGPLIRNQNNTLVGKSKHIPDKQQCKKPVCSNAMASKDGFLVQLVIYFCKTFSKCGSGSS